MRFQSNEQAAGFARAIGFGENFFGSGQLTELVERYKAERGTDETETEVEVTLRDGERFLVSHVRVATHYVVFYTELDEHICVPHSEVVQVRIGRRTKPAARRHTGFSVDRVDEAPNPSL